jgi:hypothetical protein
VPVTTSPVSTPMRTCTLVRNSRVNASLSAARASIIPRAARTARSASSSCTTGTPNTAIAASPMNFSTVPPWRSITPCMTVK